jgi:hypothetical protein
MTAYAIVFRSVPDVDHMAPLAWRLLEDGDEVHAVIAPDYEPGDDYRLRFLTGYEGFHVHRVRGWRRTLPWALGFLLRRRIRLVAVDWGWGLPDGFDRLASPRGAAALVRAVAGSLRHVRDRNQVRKNLLVGTRLLGRASVCLPHGLSIKLDSATNEELREKLKDGPLDWRDRNRFAAYVLNTEHHRAWFLENAMGDPSVMQTWGALRWAPEWFDVNRRIAPGYEWPEETTGRVRVVYMVPKWNNNVDADAAIALLRELQDCEEASVVIRGHARPGYGQADRLRDDPSLDWTRLHDAGNTDSVSLIAEADVVIDIGSSIGLEVVLQDRVLVNPGYLHDIRTLFDVIPGTCVLAHEAGDVIGYLREHAAGRRHEVPPDALTELMRRAVYGSADEPFDVLDTYGRRLRRLALEPAH